MTTNIFLDSILKKFPGFRGTFSSDTAPIIKNNESIIINFSKENTPGTHFIAFFSCKGENYYFDSLNVNNIPLDVYNYFYNYNKVVNLSKEIQHPESIMCGFYCMMVIIASCISIDFLKEEILPLFNTREMSNDDLCAKMIPHLIKRYFKKKN
jgi:hypothetical protein